MSLDSPQTVILSEAHGRVEGSSTKSNDHLCAAEVPFSILCETHSVTVLGRQGHTMLKVAPHGKCALKVGLSPIDWQRHVAHVEDPADCPKCACDGKSEIRNPKFEIKKPPENRGRCAEFLIPDS